MTLGTASSSGMSSFASSLAHGCPEPDEFYHFPCRQIKHFNVEHLVKRGYDVFCGGMEDMVPQTACSPRCCRAPTFRSSSPPLPHSDRHQRCVLKRNPSDTVPVPDLDLT